VLGWVRLERRYHAKFSQMFALHAFPYDVQDLTITIRLPKRCDAGRHFVQYEAATGPQMEFKDWVKLSEWVRYEPRACTKLDSAGRARYEIVVPMVRKSEYYTLNVMGVMACICMLSFVAFAIDAEDLADRASVVLTLLLTAVAFKLVVADALPKISYVTVLDIYMDFQFLLIFGIALQNGFVAAFAKIAPATFGAWANHLEAGTFVACLAIWIAFHLWFLFKVRQVKAETQGHLNGALRASEAADKRHAEAESKARAQAAQGRAVKKALM